MVTPRTVFISYAREDSRHAEALHRHLAEFERQHGGDVFYDQARIDAGYRWDVQIDAALNHARLVLLLISSHFIRSAFCIETEARLALARHRLEPEQTLVMPVLLSACKYQDTAPDPHSPPLGRIQLAGPFRPTDGRPVPLDQVDDSEAAWAAIVQKIYHHFGLGPRTSADKLPRAAASAEPGADVDLADLLAWCDRAELLAAIDDHLEAPASPAAALLCVAGDAANRAEKLMDRMHVELGEAPRSHRVQVVHMHKDYGFDRPARVGKAALEALGLRADAELAPWMRRDKVDLLLLCHYADCTDWPTAKIAAWLQSAAAWLHGLDLQAPQRLVLVSTLRFTHVTPSWLDRMLRRGGDVVPRIREAHETSLGAAPLSQHSAGALVVLGDYPTEDLRKWLALERVRSGLGRVARDLDERTLSAWCRSGTCGHADLLKHLSQRYSGTNAPGGTPT